jgi:3-hydroxyisobutyrate dehydrogenase-like beta-hydroxyacid dehydrogenase
MAKDGSVLLMSTVPSSTARSLQAKLHCVRADLSLLDCPVSGGVARAALGDLTLLCSGDSLGLGVAWPVLQAMSSTHGNKGNLWIIPGGVGNGSAVKMTHQALAGTQINLVTEVMAFAARSGVSLRSTHRLLLQSTGSCGVLGPRGKNMLDGKLKPDSTVDIWVKDLSIVSAEAESLGVPVYFSTHVLQSSIMASSYGWGMEDDSRLVDGPP